MKLSEYFENTKGFGVLSTADQDGRVNSAVFARPHFMEDGTLAMIMHDRLTHENLKSNPRASYLFKEKDNGYVGKRLYLSKVGEEKESQLLYELRRRSFPPEKEPANGDKYLVFFKLEKELPLIGTDATG